MKKSIYLAQRKKFWLSRFQDPESISSEDHASGPAAERARLDVRAAEAAGVVWDPEPLPIPESLIYHNGELQPGRVGRESASMGTWAYPPDLHRDATLREAARRYNAWPELEKLAETMGPGMGLCGGCEIFYRELDAILRGS